MARVGLVARGVVGLAGYAVWRLVRAGIGHGTEQRDSGFQRIAGVVSGVAHAALCVTAVKILAGASSSGGSNSPKQTTAGVLSWTGGTLIVGVVGAILIGVALGQGYKGVSKKFLFLDNSKAAEMTARLSAAPWRSVSSVTSHGWSFSGLSVTACSAPRSTIPAQGDRPRWSPQQAVP